MKDKMRDKTDEELLRLIRAADPADRAEWRDWADSEDGRRLYARIIAEREDEQLAASPRWPRTLWMALAAAAALVVVAAIVVGVLLGLRESPGAVVHSTTTTVITPGEAVDRVAALSRVVLVAEAVRIGTGTQWRAEPSEGLAAYVDRAESLGIILSTEHDTAATPGPVSRGAYALWLWRGFGDLLPQRGQVEFTDLGALPDEVRQAVLGVAGTGILEGDANGRFEADRSLTVEEEQEAVARLEVALGLSPDAARSD